MKRPFSPKDEATVREIAGQEWDSTVPRWSMTREAFMDWHVRMIRGDLRRKGVA